MVHPGEVSLHLLTRTLHLLAQFEQDCRSHPPVMLRANSLICSLSSSCDSAVTYSFCCGVSLVEATGECVDCFSHMFLLTDLIPHSWEGLFGLPIGRLASTALWSLTLMCNQSMMHTVARENVQINFVARVKHSLVKPELTFPDTKRSHLPPYQHTSILWARRVTSIASMRANPHSYSDSRFIPDLDAYD